VICFDEWGPLELKPLGGTAWARRRYPQTMRATYRRPKGTEQFLGFYDVHADCLSGLFRRRKRVAELSEAFCRLRACYPRRPLFVIMDNLRNVHDHPTFVALLRRLHIHPVYTPTEASWLNAIEAHFGVTKRLTGSDDHDMSPAGGVSIGYLRYRNRRVGQEDHPLPRIRSSRPIKLDRH